MGDRSGRGPSCPTAGGVKWGDDKRCSQTCREEAAGRAGPPSAWEALACRVSAVVTVSAEAKAPSRDRLAEVAAKGDPGWQRRG